MINICIWSKHGQKWWRWWKMKRFKFDQSKSGKVLGGACYKKNTFELISELVSVVWDQPNILFRLTSPDGLVYLLYEFPRGHQVDGLPRVSHHLRASYIDDFGGRKKWSSGFSADRIGSYSKHSKLNTHSKSPFDLNIHTKNISRLNNCTFFWHMSNNKNNAPETGFRIQTWSSCSFYAQEKAYGFKSLHSNLNLIIKIFLNDKLKMLWKTDAKRAVNRQPGDRAGARRADTPEHQEKSIETIYLVGLKKLKLTRN
jgi:hypothetical protein